jgi:hypothetical protein
LDVQDLTSLGVANMLVKRISRVRGVWGAIPAVHVRYHVDFRLCLRNLLLRGDLRFLAEEHRHLGRVCGGVIECVCGECNWLCARWCGRLVVLCCVAVSSGQAMMSMFRSFEALIAVGDVRGSLRAASWGWRSASRFLQHRL